jgi:hypothetical protein
MRLPFLAPQSMTTRGYYHIIISLVCGYLGLIIDDNAVFAIIAGTAVLNVVMGLEMLNLGNTSSERA